MFDCQIERIYIDIHIHYEKIWLIISLGLKMSERLASSRHNGDLIEASPPLNTTQHDTAMMVRGILAGTQLGPPSAEKLQFPGHL